MQVVSLAGVGNMSRGVGKRHKEGGVASVRRTINAATAIGN